MHSPPRGSLAREFIMQRLSCALLIRHELLNLGANGGHRSLPRAFFQLKGEQQQQQQE